MEETCVVEGNSRRSALNWLSEPRSWSVGLGDSSREAMPKLVTPGDF